MPNQLIKPQSHKDHKEAKNIFSKNNFVFLVPLW
jgi:hypothetical protein